MALAIAGSPFPNAGGGGREVGQFPVRKAVSGRRLLRACAGTAKRGLPAHHQQDSFGDHSLLPVGYAQINCPSGEKAASHCPVLARGRADVAQQPTEPAQWQMIAFAEVFSRPTTPGSAERHPFLPNGISQRKSWLPMLGWYQMGRLAYRLRRPAKKPAKLPQLPYSCPCLLIHCQNPGVTRPLICAPHAGEGTSGFLDG
jgi:hypothetical protein